MNHPQARSARDDLVAVSTPVVHLWWRSQLPPEVLEAPRPHRLKEGHVVGVQVERHPGPLPYGVGCKDVIEVSMSRHHSDQTQAVALGGRHDVVGLVPGIDHHGLIGFGVADQVAVALELPNDQMLVDLECHGYNLPRRRRAPVRSEEHTSELQSRSDLVCRLLLEKKKKKSKKIFLQKKKNNKKED